MRGRSRGGKWLWLWWLPSGVRGVSGVSGYNAQAFRLLVSGADECFDDDDRVWWLVVTYRSIRCVLYDMIIVNSVMHASGTRRGTMEQVWRRYVGWLKARVAAAGRFQCPKA